MLTIYDTTGSALVKHDETVPSTSDTVWFDLLEPTKEEDERVEALLKISVPTREEMRDIEASSRFYRENGASYMTAFIVHDLGASAGPLSSTVTFILTGNSLVTVRYCDPKAFGQFPARVARGEATSGSGAAVFVGLVEALIEHQADLIQGVQDTVDKLAASIFDVETRRRDRESGLGTLLKGTGTQGDTVARLQESAFSLARLLHVFKNSAIEANADVKIVQRIQVVDRDVQSLTEHMRFLSERISFLLNATLGMISTEQNQIIKLFSVMAVMMMPPTLVASVYGMNFQHMPELAWVAGYPIALGAMLVSALVPYVYFRYRGWL